MKPIRKFILFVFSVVLFVVMSVVLQKTTSNITNPDWIIFIIIMLVALYLADVWKYMSGQEITWDSLTRRDKLLFSIGIAILLFCIGWPMKMGFSFTAGLVCFLVGFILVWIFISFFGSQVAKKHWLWPKF